MELTRPTTQPIVPLVSPVDKPHADQRIMTVTRSVAMRAKLEPEVAAVKTYSVPIHQRVFQ